MARTRPQRWEVASFGVDESLQGFGSSPFSGPVPAWSGLRVPAFVNTPDTRYLFLLCSFAVGSGTRRRLVGARQKWSLGVAQPQDDGRVRTIEHVVRTPDFKLPDGNVSWAITVCPTRSRTKIDPRQLPNFAFRVSQTPALLYEDFQQVPASGYYFLDLTAYTPPNGGRPWGRPIDAGLSSFYHQRFPWDSAQAWTSLDVVVQGPVHVDFYASVLQSDPARRPNALFPSPPPLGSIVGPPEEAFLANVPQAVIWRVAGALVFADD